MSADERMTSAQMLAMPARHPTGGRFWRYLLDTGFTAADLEHCATIDDLMQIMLLDSETFGQEYDRA